MELFRDSIGMPLDEHNNKLLKEVHPEDWRPPKPEPIYNLVVIGAGTAGLISAVGCAALGGRVALVERHLMGGDCLNAGCVPSKALIRSSRAAAETASAVRFGLTPHQVAASDFPAVMERLRRLRARISRNDSARRYSELGVHVFFGEASFRDRQSITVDGIPLRFRKAVIATGASPVHPDINGLAGAGFRTNETIFNLTELPSRLAVIGGGPIGCELAQAFRRLGSEVTILQNTRLLPREDTEASTIIEDKFRREGIKVLLDVRLIRAEKDGEQKRIIAGTRDGERTIVADEILVGTGRRPNIANLSLSNAGVDFDAVKGIRVNDFLRTTNPRIYAAGDVCMHWKFTHAADAAARIAVQNALFLGRKRLSALNMPWCTYTDPEIAHVGLYEEDARTRNIETDTYKVTLDEVDRAVVDGETEGFVKILVKKGTDRIVGATIVAAHAGDLISEISVAMAGKIGLKTLADVMHPYPTQAEAIRRAAAAYNRTRLTPHVSALFKWWLKRQRGK
ncbi:MAG: mercuric reductase [Acidobacteria bacterium]|nr:mercuric reductase [Acidobacteriota bacterium]